MKADVFTRTFRQKYSFKDEVYLFFVSFLFLLICFINSVSFKELHIRKFLPHKHFHPPQKGEDFNNLSSESFFDNFTMGLTAIGKGEKTGIHFIFLI